LDQVDKDKRGELKLAILQVMHDDPEIKRLLRVKTDEVYQKLRRKGGLGSP